MAPLVTVRRLLDPADASLTEVEPIYVDGIPACERKPLAWLRSLPARADYRLFVAEREAAVVGFAVVFAPADPTDAALLEYMAVDAAARGGGIGGQLFAAALRGAGRPMLIEVKADDPDAERRRAFYRRHGCREIAGLAYLLPMPGAPPMRLMVARADAVRRSDLSHWLATVYAVVYGQEPDDRRIDAMVSGLNDPVGLA